MKILLAALMFMSCALIARGAPISDTQAIEYLVRFGYLDPKLSADEKKMALKKSLQDFQELMGLEKTGELGKETQEILQRVRCGVPDKFDFVNNNMRLEREAFHKTKWESEEVTYRIYKYPRNLTCAAVDEVFAQAFHMFFDVTNLVFRQVSGMADINIGFLSREHGDEHPFIGTTYAHAWKPPIGVMHFDADSSWSIRNSSGDDLLQIAVHEIGHTLGLSHIFGSDTVMRPVMEPIFNSRFGLRAVDIEKIQELYGKKKNKIPDLCSNSSIDAIFEYPAGVIYIFKGDYYWKLTPDGIASRYPRLISHRWPGVPGNVDAATATSVGETYFFKGNKFWKFHHTTPCNSNPTYISMGWPGMPNNVDAVTWRGRSLFYFFKGDQYWQYDGSQYHEYRYSYAKSITDWGGITGDVDDVLYVASGYLYLFSHGIYYRYNCITGLIDYGPPSYPRPVATWWFHCYNTPATADIATQEIYTDTYDRSSTLMTEDTDFTTAESESRSDDYDDMSSMTEVDVITEMTTAEMIIAETYTDDTTLTDFEYITGSGSGDETDDDMTTIEVTDDDTSTIEVTDDDTTTIEVTDDDTSTIEITDDDTTTIEVTDNDTTTIEVTDNDTTTIEVTDNDTTTIEVSDDDTTTIEATDDTSDDIYIDENVTISTDVSEDFKTTTDGDKTDTTDSKIIIIDGDKTYDYGNITTNVSEDIMNITTEETDTGSGSGSGDGDDTEMTDESETTTYTEEPTIPPEGSELIDANANNLLKAERLSLEVKSWSSNAEWSSFSSFLIGLMAIMGQLHRILDP